MTFNTSSTSISNSAPVCNREETIQNTIDIPSSSSTSTSGNRLDELASMLDSCFEQLTPLTALGERIEKETAKILMFTKRMMETPSQAPPLVKSPLVESADRTSVKHGTPLCPESWNTQCTWLECVAACTTRLTSSTTLFLSAAAERRFVRDAKEELRHIGADYDTVHR